MANSQTSEHGTVATIWRYPVKSMRGEETDAVLVGELGVLGDRAYALVDSETGKVASTKNPRRWPRLLEFQASLVDSPAAGRPMPPARITFPDGQTLLTDQPEIESRISAVVGRTVTLARAPIEGAKAEGYRPEYTWLPHAGEEFEYTLPPGTFFDGATVHLVTTATLRRLSELAPESRFDIRRFRANFLIEMAAGAAGFVENDWIGRRLTIGEAVLQIDRPCPRCVITTLPQGDLAKDPNVLRTVVQNNQMHVGVYASVVRGGSVRRGDEVSIS